MLSYPSASPACTLADEKTPAMALQSPTTILFHPHIHVDPLLALIYSELSAAGAAPARPTPAAWDPSVSERGLQERSRCGIERVTVSLLDTIEVEVPEQRVAGSPAGAVVAAPGAAGGGGCRLRRLRPGCLALEGGAAFLGCGVWILRPEKGVRTTGGAGAVADALSMLRASPGRPLRAFAGPLFRPGGHAMDCRRQEELVGVDQRVGQEVQLHAGGSSHVLHGALDGAVPEANGKPIVDEAAGGRGLWVPLEEAGPCVSSCREGAVLDCKNAFNMVHRRAIYQAVYDGFQL
ncbi:hypothetical protein CYMTET_45502 [Cymbomonas tetramitiformis]|uniref:Uncharacterized protein n=1 Tax=Cymbomonas tetramitiformis TaxID=36881 RepID=A0AAE0BZV5_9CHLO|nr:hypothetical protein CYMTET_45502 [Cymbomonas tetramitiformis]